MREFARLYAELDATASTQAKVEALQRHLQGVALRDAAWAVYFLAGGKPRQRVPVSVLTAAACDEAGLAPWLFEESYQAVGDLAETISLVLPPGPDLSDLGLADWMEQRLLPLRGQPPDAVASQVRTWWRELDTAGRFLLVKLVSGGFRVGVSRLLVQRALAAHAGLDPKQVAQRMMGYTDARQWPTAERLQAVLAPEGAPGEATALGGQPYPFFLAHPLQEAGDDWASRLGPVADWLVEWKYDGIRAQVVRRGGQAWIWSRGEELVTDRFPEVQAMAAAWPDGTVVDGEILAAGPDGRPGPFAQLQQRITRKSVTRKVLLQAPVTFMAYDLLEAEGCDLRTRPLRERRARLEALAQAHALPVSPAVVEPSWPAYAELRHTSRARGVEGFMVKRLDAGYGVGRTKADGLWWKWKVDPMTVDAVLVYAQAGHGRRASVYTDYTFAVWSRPPADAAEAEAVLDAIARREPPQPGALQLVPFAKAYSGLTDEEFRRVDAIIRRSTVDKFGPVRSVRPSLVFELAFEGLQVSGRHRSGIALRFPRMLRIRDDKPLHEAGTLPELQSLLSSHSGQACVKSA
jgi:DNA ligase-1